MQDKIMKFYMDNLPRLLLHGLLPGIWAMSKNICSVKIVMRQKKRKKNGKPNLT